MCACVHVFFFQGRKRLMLRVVLQEGVFNLRCLKAGERGSQKGLNFEFWILRGCHLCMTPRDVFFRTWNFSCQKTLCIKFLYSVFFWSVFSCIPTECGDLQRPEKLRIRTLFRQRNDYLVLRKRRKYFTLILQTKYLANFLSTKMCASKF